MTGAERLELAFDLRRGTLDLAVDLAVERGETVAIVGPNGAGKSTLLAAVAGLLPVRNGHIRWAGRDLVRVEAGREVANVPPEDRGVGLVFQEPLLFPHLSVVDNVAFGPASRGAGFATARTAAALWLERVGMAAVAERRATDLSVGQAQRVAIARALAAEPDILLLDEPLAAVDATARVELRSELRRHLADFDGVRLVVAHDAIDALALADRVAVLENGRLTQVETVATICSRPRSRYVADLVGVNLLRGSLRDGRLTLHGGGSLVVPAELHGEVLATVHPRAVALYRQRPDGSPRNVFEVPIEALEAAGNRVRVQLGGDVPLVAEVTPAAVADLGLGAGGRIWAALKATEIDVFPA